MFDRSFNLHLYINLYTRLQKAATDFLDSHSRVSACACVCVCVFVCVHVRVDCVDLGPKKKIKERSTHDSIVRSC